MLDPNRALFGAAYHNYDLNPPLSEDAIVHIENDYSMYLPDDYRTFILEVGDGGAGPFYGLFRLGEHDSGMVSSSWADGFLLGDPAAPFPYMDSWNLPDSFWAEAPYNQRWPSEEEADRAYEVWDAQLEENYYSGSTMNGSIPVCHRGCALRKWMVVTGSERGNIWNDDRAVDGDLAPLQSPSGTRVSFHSWYCDWLN